MNGKAVFCPACDYRLKLNSSLHLGQRLVCSECETSLKVINLTPIELESVALIDNDSKPKKKTRSVEVFCPECEATIKLNAKMREGQLLKCNRCNVTLEVITTHPFELDIADLSNVKGKYKNKDKNGKKMSRKAGKNSKDEWA